MGCRAAAKSKVVEGCGRWQFVAGSSSPRCSEVITELPSETTVIQKRENRGSSVATSTEEEEEEEELSKGRSQWTFKFELSIDGDESTFSR